MLRRQCSGWHRGRVLYLLSRFEIYQSKIFEGKKDYQLYVRLSNLIAFLSYWELLPKNFQIRLTEAYCIDVLLFFEAGQQWNNTHSKWWRTNLGTYLIKSMWLWSKSRLAPPHMLQFPGHTKNVTHEFIPCQSQYHQDPSLLHDSLGPLEAGHQIKVLLILFPSPLTGKGVPSFHTIYFPQTSSKIKWETKSINNML